MKALDIGQRLRKDACAIEGGDSGVHKANYPHAHKMHECLQKELFPA
jgi:hypothetical protein